jgi:transposase
MIRTLRSARHSAVKARSQAANQLQGFVVTAPEKLRNRLRELTTKKLVSVAARLRPGEDLDGVEAATKFALRSLARRYQALSREIAELDAQLDRLVAEVAPELISLAAIGTDHAATLLLTAGDNPERLGSEASFASLCAVPRPWRRPPAESFATASTLCRKPRRQSLPALDLRGAHANR